ncbi:hypothetical protein J32TS6_24120 [Virgibacillus pantothenticus]|uniref:hypothetical protein n=1 Tax=Virgibacillus pantothenticus TaxID=1473 RepID=UPI001B0B96FE|nr:hypothetical protein [Virgibacillus pantothenticus]GIP63857.1 hypothetical protein J32TS6_24120 [Virgibacillus pantothenticus]
MTDKQRQFKETQNHGEHRNGRKSPYKNSNSYGEGEPNEYVNEQKRKQHVYHIEPIRAYASFHVKRWLYITFLMGQMKKL